MDERRENWWKEKEEENIVERYKRGWKIETEEFSCFLPNQTNLKECKNDTLVCNGTIKRKWQETLATGFHRFLSKKRTVLHCSVKIFRLNYCFRS